MSLGALLVDGGGTLFPESLSVPDEALLRPGACLSNALPELAPKELRHLLMEFLTAAEAHARAGVQPTDRLIARLLEATSPGLGNRARAFRAALAKDGWQRRLPYPGAVEMLLTAKRRGMVTVLVSNTAWLSEQDYRARMVEMGLALDSLVSSFDIGVRKPHRAMFDAALERAGCPPQRCVMVGDNEVNDIEPAAGLGMRTIRVTMQYRVPGTSRADAVAASLKEVAAILRSWCQEAPAVPAS